MAFTGRKGLGRREGEVMEKMLNDAAMENDIETLRRLLQEDPLILDKATLNPHDNNPLHTAAAFGHVDFMQAILDVCPDMCLAGNRFGRIPLHLAIIKGRLEVLQELIHARPLATREKIDGGGNALHLCVKHNQLGALKILVQAIKDDDFANAKNDDGMTILHLAVCDKQYETIRYLLQSKIVEVNAKNANRSTALDLFHEESNPEIARSLRVAGAKRSEEIEPEKGPPSYEMEKRLYDAAVENDTATLFKLLQQDPALLHKTNLNSEDKNPLHVAAMLGNVGFARAILRERKSASQYMCFARDRDGKNPLHLAAMCGELGVLLLFLDEVSPAAAAEKTDVGETILHLCVKYDQPEAVKLLIDRFKDDKQLLNAQNKDGMTILHLAIYYKQYQTIRYLLASKIVEVNAKNANGSTALDLFQEESNPEIARSLRLVGAKRSEEIEPEKGQPSYQMEKRLYDAAVKNDTATLLQLLQEDPALLNKTNLNSEDKNPLHVAAMLGNVDFAEAILREEKSASQYMCLAHDRDGKNPLHIAAMCGKLGVLQLFLDAASPASAREKTDAGETILHLCVKYNQPKVLKLLIDRFKDDKGLLNAQNNDGMTILHLAIYYKQYETLEFLTQRRAPVEFNIQSANGKTELDYLLEQSDPDPRTVTLLRNSGAVTGQLILLEVGWNKNIRESLMVVAILITTMAFQAGVTPPGGYWQDDLLDGPNPHRAGESILAQTHPKYYGLLIRANTVAFVSSLSTILLLRRDISYFHFWFYRALLIILIGTAFTTISIAYAIAIGVASPSSAGVLHPGGLVIVVPLAVLMTWLVIAIYRGALMRWRRARLRRFLTLEYHP